MLFHTCVFTNSHVYRVCCYCVQAQESDSEGIKKVNRVENVDQEDTSDDSE